MRSYLPKDKQSTSFDEGNDNNDNFDSSIGGVGVGVGGVGDGGGVFSSSVQSPSLLSSSSSSTFLERPRMARDSSLLAKGSTHSFASSNSFDSTMSETSKSSSIANQVDRFKTYKPQSTSMFLAPDESSSTTTTTRTSSSYYTTTTTPTASIKPTINSTSTTSNQNETTTTTTTTTKKEEKPTAAVPSKRFGRSFALPNRSKSELPSSTTSSSILKSSSRRAPSAPKRSKSIELDDVDAENVSASTTTKPSWMTKVKKKQSEFVERSKKKKSPNDTDQNVGGGGGGEPFTSTTTTATPSWVGDRGRSRKPSETAFIISRRIVSLDIDPDDVENWHWRLFPEKTSIEYTPHLDHIADRAYESRHYLIEQFKKHPQPERKPGISGYDFEKILAAERGLIVPEDTPELGGVFGDYMAERRKLAQWKAQLIARGKMCIRIQSAVRRFLARIEYHERNRLREMERKRIRIQEIAILLEEKNQVRLAALEKMNIEFEKRRVKERESFFENFKVKGRREMLETRKMVAMKPDLHRQSKSLKARRQEIRTETDKLIKQNEEVQAQIKNLEAEAAEYQKKIKEDAKVLASTEYLCLIEKTLRKTYEKGLTRTITRIENAAPNDVELVETLKDMAKFCVEVSKMRHATSA